MIQQELIDDSEEVARIINSEWMVDGELQQAAFTLNPNETYLSVNRTSIDSYEDDVRSFVASHERFQFDKGMFYKVALLSVSDVRSIKVFNEDDQQLNINVEVEPRSTHTKSHAGIFVRYGSNNIIPSREVPEDLAQKVVSTDMILQDVRWELLELAKLQTNSL